MKLVVRILLLLITCMLSVNIGFAETYRSNGEIYFVNEQTKSEWNRRIFSAVVSEDPVIIEQGTHIVSMVFTIDSPPSINYSLTVTLMTKPKSKDEISTILFNNTYESTLVGGSNGPLEFEEELNGLKFGGAVGLGVRK